MAFWYKILDVCNVSLYYGSINQTPALITQHVVIIIAMYFSTARIFYLTLILLLHYVNQSTVYSTTNKNMWFTGRTKEEEVITGRRNKKKIWNILLIHFDVYCSRKCIFADVSSLFLKPFQKRCNLKKLLLFKVNKGFLTWQIQTVGSNVEAILCGFQYKLCPVHY